LRRGFRDLLIAQALEAADLNRRNIIAMAAGLAPLRSLCDLGCDDGAHTSAVAEAVGAAEVSGVEVMADRARLAQDRGVKVAVAPIEDGLPFADASFDLVHSNQVIEHVADVDVFLSETHRVLRPGGWAIISTENAASWHNVFAAAMGWQIFSLTNVSTRALGLGNPLAPHRGEEGISASWRHKTILSYRGLKELAGVHGLTPTEVVGAGYYPLPAAAGRLDTRHAHFITLLARKSIS
jgi:SAM-dependent methyltransferase